MLPSDAQASGIGRVEAGENAQHGRLAAARFADEAEGLALPHLKADAVHGPLDLVVVTEADDEVVHGDHGLGCGHR